MCREAKLYVYIYIYGATGINVRGSTPESRGQEVKAEFARERKLGRPAGGPLHVRGWQKSGEIRSIPEGGEKEGSANIGALTGFASQPASQGLRIDSC